MESSMIIAISLGTLAGVIVLIGVIVCAVKFGRQRALKKQNPYQKDEKGLEYDMPASTLPPAEKGTSEVVPVQVPMTDTDDPSTVNSSSNTSNAPVPDNSMASSKGVFVPSMVPKPPGTLLNETDPKPNPVIMNPANLSNQWSTAANNTSTGSTLLNPPTPAAVPNVPAAGTGTTGFASVSNEVPAQREVLNNPAPVAPFMPPSGPVIPQQGPAMIPQQGPIIPQQAQLLYPFMPRQAPNSLYPTLAVPAPPTVLPPATPAYTTLPNTINTANVNPVIGLGQGQGQSQMRADGFTVFPATVNTANYMG